MLPEPRITDDKVLTIQMKIEPRNATLAYATACVSASPWPPRAANKAGPKTSISSMNSAPMATPIHSACTASALARAGSPAPSARLTADETPPPMAPADIIICSMTSGNTSAMPASEATPKLPT